MKTAARAVRLFLAALLVCAMLCSAACGGDKAAGLTVGATEHRDGETVFDCTAGQFIEAYNALYRLGHDGDYLPPFSGWRADTAESAPHSVYPTRVLRFQEDERLLSLPTITICTPDDSELVGEITVDFDDHAFSDGMFALFGEMSEYTLGVMLPSMSGDELTALWRELVELADGSVTDRPYGADPHPCVLFRLGEVGVYPYYALGNYMHICIVPVTPEYCDRLAAEGVELRELAPEREDNH